MNHPPRRHEPGSDHGPREPHGRLDPAQLGVGDMDAAAFREHGRAVVDWIADYLERVEELPVLSRMRPGDIRRALPSAPPGPPEPFADLLADLDRTVLPGITHWNHPTFHAYFAITGSGPGILGEALAAALNVNGMLWRTSPSATELEEVVLDWLRQLLGLDAGWRGMITDTASMSTMLALAAARERTGLDVRQRGLAGRTDLPMLRVYTSTQAHSSVEKAAIALGLGRDGVRLVDTDDHLRLDPDELAAAVREDVRFGFRPMAVVATVGTTSTTAVDPVEEIADVRDGLVPELGHDVWLHVDGAYGAMAAICPELRWVLSGIDRADSLVTNPHKWLFTPIDCSALYLRDVDALTTAFTLVPEYLSSPETDVTDYMDWGVQLGRRFRALKLWLVLRYFGAEGLARRIRLHVGQARELADWVEAHPDLELVAQPTFSTVCFRAAPRWLTSSAGERGAPSHGPGSPSESELTRLNQRLLERINASGRALLSHTVVGERFLLRLATGNLRTTGRHLVATRELIEELLDGMGPGGPRP